jgi:hypothetical protein
MRGTLLSNIGPHRLGINKRNVCRRLSTLESQQFVGLYECKLGLYITTEMFWESNIKVLILEDWNDRVLLNICSVKLNLSCVINMNDYDDDDNQVKVTQFLSTMPLWK